MLHTNMRVTEPASSSEIGGEAVKAQQHRITGGIGIQDVLPGIDVDLFAGGMFRNTQTFGTTTASLTGYWIGFATTWHFGRGACEYGDWR